MSYLGTIAADELGSKTNATTASPFRATGEALKGMELLIQPDADCYFGAVETSNGTISADTSLFIPARAMAEVNMGKGQGFLAVLGSTGAVNLKVFFR